MDEANSYRHFIAQFDRIVDEEWAARAKGHRWSTTRRGGSMMKLRLGIMVFPYAVLNFILSLAVRIVPGPMRRAIKSMLARIPAIIVS